MTAHAWKKDRALSRVKTRLAEVKTVEIKPYVRDTDLNSLPRNKAYRVDGVHIYIDILNLQEMLGTTDAEGVTCHKRTLRFLNLHYRAAHRILGAVDAIEVDFHNQRLHAVVAKPYGDEEARVQRAVAIAQLVRDVLAVTGDEGDEIIPAAKVRVGIDSGVALAVVNGRRGHGEPLFLGRPANHAAKRAGGGSSTGIYLTNEARAVIGLSAAISEDITPLTITQIGDCQSAADLPITAAQIVRDWRADLQANPIGKFVFSGHTPPFSNLDLELLSPANSRRQDAVSLYADIDGFTNYVAAHIDDDLRAKDVVRVLHVLRSEMDAVVHDDFGGRKVRFIGDCIHAVIAEGTAQTTDMEESVSTAILCAGGIRSSFDLALEALAAEKVDVGGLGLQIGLELGPLALTRLGVKGAMLRCAVGRCVLGSEAEQGRCRGTETALGATAYAYSSVAAQSLFGSTRKRAALDYQAALDALSGGGDKTAKAAVSLAKALQGAGAGLLAPASAAAGDFRFPPRSAAPTKPAGFA
jgi:class 3 adenylate cyclase